MPTGGVTASGAQVALAQAPESALARFPTFEHVIELIRANRDQLLKVEVEDYVRLVAYQPGRIEFEPAPRAPKDLAQKLGQRLQFWTGVRWAVSVTGEGGAPSITEARNAETNALKDQAKADPVVAAIFEVFPQARIGDLKTAKDIAARAEEAALEEVEDEWDPFEEE